MEAIEAMFDGISYNKGGSVLRMLRAYLDRDTPSVRLRRLLQVRSCLELHSQGVSYYFQEDQGRT